MKAQSGTENPWKRNLIGGGVFVCGMVIGVLTVQPTLNNLEESRDHYRNLYNQKNQEMADWAEEQAEAGYKLIYLKNYCAIMDNYFSRFEALEDLYLSEAPSLLNTTSWKKAVKTYESWQEEYKKQDCKNIK